MSDVNESNYDNDELMADLGRTVFNQVAGMGQRGCSDEQIGDALLQAVVQYVFEDQ